MKILVSGACGVTSRAIVRSIKKSKKYQSATIIGTDICENSYGLFEGLYERIWRVPHVNDPKYPEIFIEILKKEEIDRVILIPELEVLYWSKNKLPVKYLSTPPKFSEIAISKEKLYSRLRETNLIPVSQIISKSEINSDTYTSILDYPYWIRSVSKGSTSGKGSMLIEKPEYLTAWKTINSDTKKAMVSEYLPGRNIAVHLLYRKGTLHKIGCYQRLEYFKKDVSISGITGNICKGKLINDQQAVQVARNAVEEICSQTGEIMNGMVAVDLKESKEGRLLVTEINLRHVAATSSFALGGFNLTEHQLDLMDADFKEFKDEQEKEWPKNNQILRDIDGLPVWVENYVVPKIGSNTSGS